MRKPHKHAELIKKWADGAKIEKMNKDGTWSAVRNDWPWFDDWTYRVKPEPKPDSNLYYRAHDYVHGNGASEVVWTGDNGANLKLTFSGETGKLISAEVI
jgi:hypothetical protein